MNALAVVRSVSAMARAAGLVHYASLSRFAEACDVDPETSSHSRGAAPRDTVVCAESMLGASMRLITEARSGRGTMMMEQPQETPSVTGMVRVFLVDDHPILRSGLKALVDAQRDMVVVGDSLVGAGVTLGVIFHDAA